MPTTAELFQMSTAVRYDVSPPPGWSQFKSVDNPATGLVAGAFYNQDTREVVMAFAGPSTSPGGLIGNPGATSTDGIIANGERPVDFDNGVRTFVQEVTASPQAQDSTIFASGISLGGYAAQVAASENGFGGANFAGPGIPGFSPDGAPAPGFTSFVTRGDPIANFATDTGITWTGFANNVGAHYGQVEMLGSEQNQTTLQALVSMASEPGVDPTPALSGMAGLLVQTHSAQAYADILGIDRTAYPMPGMISQAWQKLDDLATSAKDAVQDAITGAINGAINRAIDKVIDSISDFIANRMIPRAGAAELQQPDSVRASEILNSMNPAEREIADAQDRDEAERGADLRANQILNNMTPAEREIADAQDRDEAERGADLRANQILSNMSPAEREIAANQDRDEAERGADMRELERANNLNRETTDPEMGREFIRNQMNLNMTPAEREILENMDREDAQLGDAMRANELLNGRSDAERAIEESQDRDDAELGAAMRDQQRTNELLDNLSPNERTILENQDREDADLGAAMRDSMRNNDNLDSLSPNEREILDKLDRDDAERGADINNPNDGPSFVPADQRGDAGTDNALDAFNQTSYTPDATTDQLGTDATDWSGMWNSAAELNGSSFGESSADTAAEIAGVGSGSGSGIEPPSGDT